CTEWPRIGVPVVVWIKCNVVSLNVWSRCTDPEAGAPVLMPRSVVPRRFDADDAIGLDPGVEKRHEVNLERRRISRKIEYGWHAFETARRRQRPLRQLAFRIAADGVLNCRDEPPPLGLNPFRKRWGCRNSL